MCKVKVAKLPCASVTTFRYFTFDIAHDRAELPFIIQLSGSGVQVLS